MGIKYFFSWLRKTFSGNVKNITINTPLDEIDTFLIDMNGIFHYCCQKVYQYGSFSHLRDKEKDKEKDKDKKTSSSALQRRVFEMVGAYIDKLIRFVKPKKRVFLAIDGPAPFSKQSQQRSRRYRSARDNVDGIFDSNSITPGTVFLDHLSKYLDWYIRLRLGEGVWGDISVIFSNEKTAGEGEHKLVKFVRDFCSDPNERFMMQGMDADLVMLALATQKPNFYILRENPYRYEHSYYYINLKEIRENLVNALLCGQSDHSDSIHINDFIAMIFLTGNDFLPHIPTVEILEGGVEQLFETYRMIVSQYGPLTTSVHTLNLFSLKFFLGQLSLQERDFLIAKRTKSISFPDTLLEKYTKMNVISGVYELDFEGYKKAYYSQKMGLEKKEDIKLACMRYIDGLQWVLTYYTQGVSNWKWFYPYDYAPFLSDMVEVFESYYSYKTDFYLRHTHPYSPFLQLLCVLPVKSRNLLPLPLADMMMLPEMKESYPEEFEVDMDGKHNVWEGVVKLPFLDTDKIEKLYNKVIHSVDEKDRRRNYLGKDMIYKIDQEKKYLFKSYYGDLECNVSANQLKI